MPNWVAMGVTPTKGTPRLALINVESFQREIDWLKRHIEVSSGHVVKRGELCPYLERWLLYGDNGLIAVVPHSTVETLYGYLLLEDATKQAYNALVKRRRAQHGGT